MLNFLQTIDASLVSSNQRQMQKGNETIHWTELSFVKADKSGVIEITCGNRAVENFDLKPGKNFRLTLGPKPVMAGDRAVLSPKPKLIEMEAI
jgi:hypothetical protein